MQSSLYHIERLQKKVEAKDLPFAIARIPGVGFDASI